MTIYISKGRGIGSDEKEEKLDSKQPESVYIGP
jgi:hypothetical protein